MFADPRRAAERGGNRAFRRVRDYELLTTTTKGVVTMRTNPSIAAVTGELENAGVKYEIDTRTAHPRIRWRHGGVDRQITVSATPSDYRAPRAARADCRHLLRRDGYQI
jgi:hypothetical protein